MFGFYYQNFIELAGFVKQTHESSLTSGRETNHYLWMCKLFLLLIIMALRGGGNLKRSSTEAVGISHHIYRRKRHGSLG